MAPLVAFRKTEPFSDEASMPASEAPCVMEPDSTLTAAVPKASPTAELPLVIPSVTVAPKLR